MIQYALNDEKFERFTKNATRAHSKLDKKGQSETRRDGDKGGELAVYTAFNTKEPEEKRCTEIALG